MPTAGPQSFAEFERLVDAHVTPHLQHIGYARIGAFSGPSSAAPLVAQSDKRFVRWLGRRFTRHSLRDAPLEYEVGYEALGEEAMRRVLPDDPLSVEEIWLSFEPESGSLDFSLGEGLPVLAERYDAEAEHRILLARERPLSERLRALDELLSKVVSGL